MMLRNTSGEGYRVVMTRGEDGSTSISGEHGVTWPDGTRGRIYVDTRSYSSDDWQMANWQYDRLVDLYAKGTP